MKSKILTIATCLTLGGFANAQNVNIPDTNFRNALLAHGTTITGTGVSTIDTNGDGEIQVTEAQAYSGEIHVNNMGIKSVTGIEAFTNLYKFHGMDNNITSIDLSQNTSLYHVSLTRNQLTSIDLSQNDNLSFAYCDSNNLVYANAHNLTGGYGGYVFNFRGNPLLTCIEVENGTAPHMFWVKDATASWSDSCNIPCIVHIPDSTFKAILVGNTTINTNGDTEIQCSEASAYTGTINVNNSSITDLTGIEAFVNLTQLFCNYNQLTSIDVSANTALTSLQCHNNQLSSLDVSANTTLSTLYCNNNQLTSLNVANGNNGANPPSLCSMRADGNPNLTCIQHDAGGFTPPAWTGPPFYVGWNKDATASWSTNCSGSSCANIVNIPDANFKNALINHSPTIDTDGDGEICQTEAQAYTGTINVFNKSISDLTGIEAFVNLTQLYCHNNQLTSVDVSANTALTFLNVNYNQLSSLDISANTALELLECNNNLLSSLNISTNTALEYFYCKNNQIGSLDVSSNTALIELNCNNNQLSNLDVSTNTALTDVYCVNNQLTSLNVANGNNTNLNYMYAQNNPNLNCIQHDTGFDPTTATNWTKDATASWSNNCPPVSSCTNIVNIPDANFKNALLAHGASAPVNGVYPINGTGISVIDTDGDGEICENEALAYTGNMNLNNQIIADLSGLEAFTNITTLSCVYGQHSSIDISANTALTNLQCGGNQLTNLDVSANTALTTLNCAGNQLTALNVSANTNLVELICSENTLNSLDVSANMALISISCEDNQITNLDVSANTALAGLYCDDNQLTSLNVANGNNGLTYPSLYQLYATNNPNLSCIQHDAGFDPTNSNDWVKDVNAQWSDNCSGSTSGINENNISFSIVPNPTSGMVTIDTEVEISSVEVFSTSGQKVASFETKAFDISALQSGVYFVKVLSDGGSFTTRIIKE